MVRELKVIRESIFTALQESEDFRPENAEEAWQSINSSVHLGRLDPGQWAPEALVVAHTEDGLPSAYEYEFWNRVEEIANTQGCRVYSFDVTHFTVGFFQDVRIPPDVHTWISRAAKAAEEHTRFRLEHDLNFNNISSPIEQMVYVCWETAGARLRNELDPNDHELWRHRLYPQFPLKSPEGEDYLIDFAVMKFDDVCFRRLVCEWNDRQDPYSDGNWIGDPYPDKRDEACNHNIKLAIECDSYKFHIEGMSPADFEYQTRRDRFLQKEGWTVLRFSGREISRNPMNVVDEVHKVLRQRIWAESGQKSG